MSKFIKANAIHFLDKVKMTTKIDFHQILHTCREIGFERTFFVVFWFLRTMFTRLPKRGETLFSIN